MKQKQETVTYRGMQIRLISQHRNDYRTGRSITVKILIGKNGKWIKYDRKPVKALTFDKSSRLILEELRDEIDSGYINICKIY